MGGTDHVARLGLRAGEITALELDDVDWRAGEIIVRGKGDRQERLPLPVDVGRAAGLSRVRLAPRSARNVAGWSPFADAAVIRTALLSSAPNT